MSFDDAWAERKTIQIDGLTIHVLGRRHLIENMKACGRAKDLADLAWLEHDGDASS